MPLPLRQRINLLYSEVERRGPTLLTNDEIYTIVSGLTRDIARLERELVDARRKLGIIKSNSIIPPKQYAWEDAKLGSTGLEWIT